MINFYSFFLCSSRTGFSFLFPEKKKRNKENSPAGTSEAKICTFLSKEKELASLKQLFLLHEQTHKFLHASPMRPEPDAFMLFLFNGKTHKFLHASPLMPEAAEVDVF